MFEILHLPLINLCIAAVSRHWWQGVWAIRYYQLQLIWWFPPIAAKVGNARCHPLQAPAELCCAVQPSLNLLVACSTQSKPPGLLELVRDFPGLADGALLLGLCAVAQPAGVRCVRAWGHRTTNLEP
jgi:hypothetical protein